MYVNIKEFDQAFERIKASSQSHSSCKLVVFVSCLNIDSLCAAKLLTNAFKKHLIQLQIVPVFSYGDLYKHYKALDDNINSVVLIGCGGSLDLDEFLEIEEGNLRQLYVVDTHRPWNLDNLFHSTSVTCFDDGSDLSGLKESYEKDDTEALEEYYATGQSVVASMAVQMYSLLSSIGETNLDQLWLTIVGASSLDSLYPEVYGHLQPLLKHEVLRLNPSNVVKTPDSLNLSIETDYMLFLLRHSSLYDSFYYSNYVNAKLSLWREEGKKKLHKMFATMGISLQIAQQNWLYMDSSIKKRLNSIFAKNLDQYGLASICRDGFVRTFGYKGTLSSSEFVESLTALLEDGSPSLVSSFWLAWDALDDNLKLVQEGIKKSIHLQHIISQTGVAIFEKRMVKNLRIYRLLVLQEGLPDLEVYQNPLTLLRLGNWITETHAEQDDSEKRLLPLVIAAYNEEQETYLVAGLAPRYPRFDIEKKLTVLNNFPMAFHQVAEIYDVDIKMDNFENSIVEVPKSEFASFLDRLTLSGLL